MDNINALEAAIHTNSVTPELVAAAIGDVRALLIDKAQRLSSPDVLNTELHYLALVQGGALALVPRPADGKPNKKEETE